MILEASSIAVALAAGCEYWRTRRGPLVLLAVAVTHARAAVLTARWVARQLPGMWAAVYPHAVRFVKEGM